MTANDFKKTHPVLQNFHTGKWGFERIHDCLNLNQCIYRNKKAAEMARAMAAQMQKESNAH